MITRVNIENPLESIISTIVFSPADMSQNNRDAWLYGITVGWKEATDEVAKQHEWDAETVARLHRLHAEFKHLHYLSDSRGTDSWRVEEYTATSAAGDDTVIAEIIERDDFVIAVLECEGDSEDIDEFRQDVALIASAPDLRKMVDEQTAAIFKLLELLSKGGGLQQVVDSGYTESAAWDAVRSQASLMLEQSKEGGALK